MLIVNAFDDFVVEAKTLFPNAVDFSVNWGAARGEPNCTYHDTPQGVVRVQWTSQPTQSQLDNISTKLVDAVRPLTPEQVAKRGRRAVAAKVAANSDPTLAVFMRAIGVIHSEIKAIKEGKPKPSKSLAEWQSQILNDFVNDA